MMLRKTCFLQVTNYSTYLIYSNRNIFKARHVLLFMKNQQTYIPILKNEECDTTAIDDVLNREITLWPTIRRSALPAVLGLAMIVGGIDGYLSHKGYIGQKNNQNTPQMEAEAFFQSRIEDFKSFLSK